MGGGGGHGCGWLAVCRVLLGSVTDEVLVVDGSVTDEELLAELWWVEVEAMGVGGLQCVGFCLVL